MSLVPGTQLGPYEIQALIGEGGMGEVYRARDPRLNRNVAIKVAKEHFSERFEREARAVAALNHPNICQLYDVGPNFLVMELVEGETLTCPLPAEDVLPVARQIGKALEAAHDKGIVHRDLKPANIRITREGVVKVLDFGLASLESEPVRTPPPDPATSPTRTVHATRADAIMGTAAYMSPEQARGKAVDKRTDIWAFGAVVYEMLTGRSAFEGETVTDILAGVVKSEPDWKPVPVEWQRMLRACLEKDPAQRLRDIGDAWRLMDSPVAAVSAAVKPRRTWPWVAAAAGLTVLAAALATWRLRPQPEAQLLQLDLLPPEGMELIRGDHAFELSPDGRKILMVAAGRDRTHLLWIRSLESGDWTRLHGTENARSPFWAPDSRRIGYFANGRLWKMDIEGGRMQVICDATDGDAHWTDQGYILLAENGKPLHKVAESGGQPVRVLEMDASLEETSQKTPQLLPGGRMLLYQTFGKNRGPVIAPFAGGPRRMAMENFGSPALYTSAGNGSWLLYGSRGQLFARPFDAASGTVGGAAELLASDVAPGPSWSASRNGVLAIRRRTGPQISQLSWFSREGKRMGTAGDPGAIRRPRLSPDQKVIAYSRMDSGSEAIFLFDIQRGVASRFTTEPGMNRDPVWSADGLHLFYSARRGSESVLLEKPVSGVNGEKRLRGSASRTISPRPFATAGRILVRDSVPGDSALALLTLATGKTTAVTAGDSRGDAELSPDGRWLLYSSTAGPRPEVFVQGLPGESGGLTGGGKWQISGEGGSNPAWRADGKEIYYLAPDGKMMSVSVESAADSLRPGPPKALFATEIGEDVFGRNYDVTADGQRFLLSVPVGDAPEPPLSVIVNWPLLIRK